MRGAFLHPSGPQSRVRLGLCFNTSAVSLQTCFCDPPSIPYLDHSTCSSPRVCVLPRPRGSALAIVFYRYKPCCMYRYHLRYPVPMYNTYGVPSTHQRRTRVRVFPSGCPMVRPSCGIGGTRNSTWPPLSSTRPMASHSQCIISDPLERIPRNRMHDR